MKKPLLFVGSLGVLMAAGWWMSRGRSAEGPSTGRILSSKTEGPLFGKQSARIETTSFIDGSSYAGSPRALADGVPADSEFERAQAERARLLGLDRPSRADSTFMVGRRSYRPLDSIYALSAKDPIPQDATVVERRDGLVFFRLEPGARVPSGAQAVAYEARARQLVIITGRITVQYRSSAKPADVSSDFSLELIHSFDHLNTAVFNGARPSTSELVQLLTALRNDDRVVRADLELIGARRVSQ